MFRKTKTRDFIVFLAFLLLFSGKKRNASNAKSCFTSNDNYQTFSFIHKFCSLVFDTPSPVIYRSFGVTWSAAMQIA